VQELSAVDQILKTIVDARDRPQKPTILQYYSKLYYTSCGIRERVSKAWAAVAHSLPESKRIRVTNETTAECWAEESEAFKTELKQQAVEQYKLDMELYKCRKVSQPNSVQEFSTYVSL
jgi:hypothetical protein